MSAPVTSISEHTLAGVM